MALSKSSYSNFYIVSLLKYYQFFRHPQEVVGLGDLWLLLKMGIPVKK